MSKSLILGIHIGHDSGATFIKEGKILALILNASFNIKGQPIICDPINALDCFYNTGLDILANNDFLIEK